MRTVSIFVATILALAATLRTASGSGIYADSPDIVTLNKDNFAEIVYDSDEPWVVEFYAPWCGHCKEFAPEYVRAAQSLRGMVRVGAIDCDESKRFCKKKMGVKGFPTIKFFSAEKNVYPNGEVNKTPVDYEQPRGAFPLVRTALQLIQNYGEKIDFMREDSSKKNSQLDAFLARPPKNTEKVKLGKVLFFSNKKTVTFFKALTNKFRNVLEFVEIRNPGKEIKNKFKITKMPSLFVLPSTSDFTETFDFNLESFVRYDGKINFQDIYTFLVPYADASKALAASLSVEPVSAYVPNVDEPDEWKVRHITNNRMWNRYCLYKNGGCVLAALDKNYHLEENLKFLEELAVELKGKYHVNWIGTEEQKGMLRMIDLDEVSYPAASVFAPRRYEFEDAKYKSFEGSFRDMDAWRNFVASFDKGRKRTLPNDFPAKIQTVHDDEPSGIRHRPHRDHGHPEEL